ncbi:MAG: hypothetical protein KKA64_00350 [Nanoarchaeota archaeon]|nr:hypothetical protein [Nanoarchaeota archaeon]
MNINQKINEKSKDTGRKVLSTKIEEKSLFKGKDLGLLKEVYEFLAKGGSDNTWLRGSVVEKAIRGEPRHYQDIDLLVSEGYSSAILLSFLSLKYEKYKDWKVENLSKRVIAGYVGRPAIAHRFKIRSAKTNTPIDISFEPI